MKDSRRAKALVSEYFIFVIFIALVVVLTQQLGSRGVQALEALARLKKTYFTP